MTIFFKIMQYILYLFSAYVGLSAGCEYRSYHGGHLFIKAFYAKTSYQKFFTLLQLEKDINRQDLGKLTHIGYIGIILSTVSGIFALFYCLYQIYSGNSFLCINIVEAWSALSFCWGIFAMLVQGIDSLLNRMVHLFR